MHDHDTDPIGARLRAEEERLRRRIILLTLVPAAAAVLLIAVTSRQVSRARSELTALQDSAVQLRLELEQETEHRLAGLDALALRADSLSALVTELEERVARSSAAAPSMIRDAAAQAFEAAAVRPRVYLHIAEESQRPAAAAVQGRLENAGYSVPGIELRPRGPAVSEIRFFKSDDRAGTEDIERILAEAGLRAAIRDLTARYGTSTSIRAGHYEIWFGPDFRGR